MTVINAITFFNRLTALIYICIYIYIYIQRESEREIFCSHRLTSALYYSKNLHFISEKLIIIV